MQFYPPVRGHGRRTATADLGSDLADAIAGAGGPDHAPPRHQENPPARNPVTARLWHWLTWPFTDRRILLQLAASRNCRGRLPLPGARAVARSRVVVLAVYGGLLWLTQDQFGNRTPDRLHPAAQDQWLPDYRDPACPPGLRWRGPIRRHPPRASEVMQSSIRGCKRLGRHRRAGRRDLHQRARTPAAIFVPMKDFEVAGLEQGLSAGRHPGRAAPAEALPDQGGQRSSCCQPALGARASAPRGGWKMYIQDQARARA